MKKQKPQNKSFLNQTSTQLIQYADSDLDSGFPAKKVLSKALSSNTGK